MRNTQSMRIALVLLTLTLLVSLVGCQATKDLEQTVRGFGTLPDRLGQAFINIMGGLKDIGGALANQVGDIIKNITGR